jgi:hypothetical protein
MGAVSANNGWRYDEHMTTTVRSLMIAGAMAIGMVTAIGCTAPTPHGERTGSKQQLGVAAVGTVTTDTTNYAVDQAINVTWSGLPGAQQDWIALSKFGSADTSFVSWVYTNGATDGTYSFAGPPLGGDYEVRAYSNNTYNVLARSAKITVAGTATGVATQPSYATGSPIAVTFSGLPGNTTDWLALSTVGSDVNTFVTFKYTNGLKSGSIDLDSVPDGDYTARAYENNTYNLISESAPFTVGSGIKVTTSAASYPAFSPVTINFAGLPGNTTDWIAISAVNSAPTSFVTYKYTGGATSGSVDVAGVAGGTYVARAYENNTYVILKESAPFTVTASAATLTTDKGSYTPAESALFTYSGLSGTATDWLAIALAGSDVHDFVAFQYTDGAPSGTKSFSLAGLNGSYVARSFNQNDYTLVKESAPFTVGAPPSPITTNSATYGAGTPITVSFNGLPGNATDWIAISAFGSGDTSFLVYRYTNGAMSGSIDLPGVPAGDYEARAYENNTYNVLFRSAKFTVTPAAGAAISTSANTYTDAQTITVNYAGMSGAANDWVAIALDGSPAEQYVAWVYTNGAASGSATFSAAGLAGAGPYVARAFFDNGYTVQAASPSFTVTPAGP